VSHVYPNIIEFVLQVSNPGGRLARNVLDGLTNHARGHYFLHLISILQTPLLERRGEVKRGGRGCLCANRYRGELAVQERFVAVVRLFGAEAGSR
jgi:hypothetical protein